MKEKKNKYTLGTIVARFQLASLHEMHRDLIQTVLDEHPKVLIILGLSATKATASNPLPFQPRKQMILEEFPHDKYPNLTIQYLKDAPSNEDWSKNLDRIIQDNMDVNDSAVLYGSRDSFIPSYKGKFATKELVSDRHISGTEIRAKIAEAPQSHPFFRAGAIWACYQRYPTVFTTVDVALVDPKENKILLARKPNETKYRFVGGFSTPESKSFEEDAIREVYEETSLNCNVKYIGSSFISDWRYNSEIDKIKTLFYIGYYQGAARAQDDIAEVRNYDIDKLTENDIVKEHIPLFKMFKDFWIEEKKRFKPWGLEIPVETEVRKIVVDEMIEQSRVGGLNQLKRQ